MSATLLIAFASYGPERASAFEIADRANALTTHCQAVGHRYWGEERHPSQTTFGPRVWAHGELHDFDGPGDCALYVATKIIWIQTVAKWNAALAQPDLLATCLELASRVSQIFSSPVIVFKDGGGETWDDCEASANIMELRARLSHRAVEVLDAPSLLRGGERFLWLPFKSNVETV